MGLFMSKHRKCVDKWLLTLAQFEVTRVSISAIMLQFLWTLSHPASGDHHRGRRLSGVMCMFQIRTKGQMGTSLPQAFPHEFFLHLISIKIALDTKQPGF